MGRAGGKPCRWAVAPFLCLVKSLRDMGLKGGHCQRLKGSEGSSEPPFLESSLILLVEEAALYRGSRVTENSITRF